MPRPTIAADVRDTWAGNDITAAVFAANVALCALGGTLLLAGGDQGISTPSLEVIRSTIGHGGWGAGLLAASAGLVVAACLGARSVVVVHTVIAVAHLLVAAGVVAGVLADPPGPPNASPYGVDVFLYPAALTALCAVPYWRRRARRGRTDA